MSLCKIITMNNILKTLVQSCFLEIRSTCLYQRSFWIRSILIILLYWFFIVISNRLRTSLYSLEELDKTTRFKFPLDKSQFYQIDQIKYKQRWIILTFGNDESIRLRDILRFRCWYCSSILENINRHRSDFSFIISTWNISNIYESIKV
jgi:hypothetical protein